MKLEFSDLKTPEALNEYCRRTLGTPFRRGGMMIYPCPFGTHSRPKLQVSAYQGGGRFKCWSCDRGGDIFDLHAGINTQDVQRDFPDVFRGVCDVLGVRTPDEGTLPPICRRTGRARPVPFPAVAPPTDSLCFVSALDEVELDTCRERLQNDLPLAGELLGELGLSPWLALPCTDRTTGWPLLGATEDRRLAYLYQADDDAGNTRYTGMKLRRRDKHANPCMKLVNGHWKAYGTMNPIPSNPHGIRFMWPIGKAGVPWGIHSAYGKRFMVVTEGESDCLAVLEVMEYFREIYQQDVDPDTGHPHEDTHGRLEAMIPAVVSLPGASGMKTGWDTLFAGKNVILPWTQTRRGASPPPNCGNG